MKKQKGAKEEEKQKVVAKQKEKEKKERADSKEKTEVSKEHTKQAKVKKTPVFSKSNNRQLIKNAINNVCLAGEPNKKKREEVLQSLNSVPQEMNVIVLFKDIMGGRQVIILSKSLLGL